MIRKPFRPVKTIFCASLIIWTISVLFGLAFTGGLLYVAVPFLKKVWQTLKPVTILVRIVFVMLAFAIMANHGYPLAGVIPCMVALYSQKEPWYWNLLPVLSLWGGIIFMAVSLGSFWGCVCMFLCVSTVKINGEAV